MKKLLCFLSSCLSVLLFAGCGGDSENVSNNANSESIITYNKVFGDSFYNVVNVIQQTNDGGCILAGNTQSYSKNYDVWLIKTDTDGNKLWDKTFGGNYEDFANAVQQTSDGGYILAGYTKSYGTGGFDIWLIKTDADGNKVWDKTFGGSADDLASAVLQTSDGGFILAGDTKSYGAGAIDIWLIKTDADGNKVWDKTFGGSSGDVAYDMQQTSDSGYILAGYTGSFGAGFYDVWLIKTDADGNKVWDKTFGGSNCEIANAVKQTNDGGYILAGFTQPDEKTGATDILIIKTDANGNKIWDKTFGGSGYEEAYAVQQTNDGGYVLAGDTDSYGTDYGKGLIVKTDVDGNKVWNKTLGGNASDAIYGILQVSDGGYILAGYTESYGYGGFDAWLIKTDADGNAPTEPTQ